MSRLFDESSNDYIDVGNPSALDLTGDEVTIAAWIRLTSINGEQKFFSKWAAGGQQYLLAVNSADHLFFAVKAGGVKIAEGTTVLAADVWYYAAGVYDGSDAYVYLSGIEDGSIAAAGNMPPTSSPVRIGTGSVGQGPFDGDIGHCAIWDAALSGVDVASLAAGVSPLKIRKGDSLQFYAPLNGQDPEYDVIGGLDLTVNGSDKSEEPPIPNSVVAP